jgi:glycosyltransferase involved in cell wall biosynthesis
MVRTVYFEPAGRIHSAHRELMRHPPPGYEFVTGGRVWDRLTAVPAQSDLVIHNLPVIASKLLPVPLLKAWLESKLTRPPDGTRLTYAYNHPVFRKEPWVVNVEWAHMLAGFEVKQLRRFRGTIERLLASPHCRRIITWCEGARQSILANLDSSGFADKIELVPIAVHAKRFTKAYREDRVRLLFVGSANAPRGAISSRLPGAYLYDFYQKGGQEALETFARLKPAYPQLEIVMRAAVPPELKRKYGSLPGLRILEEVIPWQELEEEFKSADIFLFPSHQVPPWGVILDAMSYELPVVTTDVYANPELVEDGKTGLVVKGSASVPYYDDDDSWIPSVVTGRRREFNRAIRRLDPGVVDRLASAIARLIEDAGRRRTLGRAARGEVEQGRHSIARRNEKLKRIFDEATDGADA